MSAKTKQSAAPVARGRLEDKIDSAYVWDRVAQGLIFLGGISAIVFVIAIFVFIAREGLGFMVAELDLGYFFTSPNWRPIAEPEPQFGALALMVGTQALGKIILRILHGFGSKIEKVEIMKTIRVEKKILGF